MSSEVGEWCWEDKIGFGGSRKYEREVAIKDTSTINSNIRS